MNMILRAGGQNPALTYQRTEKGVRFEKFMAEIRSIAASDNPAIVAEWRAENEKLVRSQKAASNAILHSYVLTQMSVAYANDEYIGGRLLPTVTTGGRLAFSYYKYSKRDQLAYPDDTMAERAIANEVTRSRTLENVSLQPRALREYVDELTMRNPEQPLSELVEATANVLEGLEFRKEKRVAALVGAAGNYGSNTTAIAAADRWDTAGGDPIADITRISSSTWNGRGPGRRVAFTSLDVWNVLRRHVHILELFKYQRGGLATPQDILNFFDIDELLIGRAWEDTANEGQTAAYDRIWPDVFGVIRVASNPSPRNASWGYSFQDRPNAETDTSYASERGTDGGWFVRSKFSDAQVVVAADTGFLYTSPIG